MHIDPIQTAKIFKAICDPNRIAIIQLLKTGEKCACEIGTALDLAQSKLSYHMKILCESGVVESWYIGKWTHYRISKAGSENAISLLKELTFVSSNAQCSKCNKSAI